MQTKQKRTNSKHRVRKFFIGLFLCLLLSGIGTGVFIWNKYGQEVRDYVTRGYNIADTVTSKTLDTSHTTVIRDKNGTVIKQLNSLANLNVTLSNTNKYLKDGFVAVEDERFYKHHGVDPWATLRAFKSIVSHNNVQGGSTITQQLVKNKILKDSEQSAKRKIPEMVIAQELEKKFTKGEILQSYLNSVYFGHGAYGVGSASRAYFDKDQKDLTAREAAVIIGLTNNPTLYDPIKNPQNSNRKVQEVLYKMYKNGVLSKAEYQKSLSEKTVIKQGRLFNEKDYTDNYAVSYAISKAAEELAKIDGFEFTYKFGSDEEYQKYQQLKSQILQENIDKILGGGYDIRTTIDMALQKRIEDATYQELAGIADINPQTGKYDLQTSVTVLDNQTHNLVAVVGGRGTAGDYVNRSYQGYRQPGSSAKPIIAYAPAFDTGRLTPNSTLLDAQIPEYPSVQNWNATYRNSPVSVREAVNWSLNTPAIRASMLTDMNHVTDDLAKMQFGRLHPYDVNNIIAIGGFTYGVTTSEMAGAYGSFTNQGNYVEPTNVETIKNVYTGEVLYQNPRKNVKVYSKEASYAMLDILKTAGNGITTSTARALADNYPTELQAGKTGTTDAYRDVYFVGQSYYYTSAVWVGRESNASLNDYESTKARTIHRAISNVLLSGKSPKDFVKPNSVNKVGNSITFSSKEDLSKMNDVISSTSFNKDEEERRTDSKNSNVTRLENDAYRIIYGLTFEEEQGLENDAEVAIEQIHVKTFTNVNKYAELLKEITSARTAINKVKVASKRNELNNRLKQMQTQVSSKYAELKAEEATTKNFERESKITSAKKDAEQKRATSITEQEKLLEEQKTIVQSNPTQANIDKLDEIIYNLNKLGKSTPYYDVVIINEHTAKLIEK